MRRNERFDREEINLKPIGAAAAAVLAGLAGGVHAEQAAAAAAFEPDGAGATRVHYVDPTNHAGFEQDDSLILGPSDPVEPFAAAPAPRQRDLFDL